VSETIYVATGELKFGDMGDVLESTPLGSCVAVCVFDPARVKGVMAHVMLPGLAPGAEQQPMRYAANAVEALLEGMQKSGSDLRALDVCLIGGANVLDRDDETIGRDNLDSLSQIIRTKGLKLLAQSVGGTLRRSVRFEISGGNISYTVGDDPKKILRGIGDKGIQGLSGDPEMQRAPRQQAEKSLHEAEGSVQRTLDAMLSTEKDIETLKLSDILDADVIQGMMDEFFRICGISMAIIELDGKVLVAVGWQDICTRFHRVHPEASRRCIESDTILSRGVLSGQTKLYKCKNNMWDVAMPINVGGRHVGNLFIGQFMFKDEPVDRDVFIRQGREFGFVEEEYLAALDRVPRWDRTTVDAAIAFFSRFSLLVATLSWNKIQLARDIAVRKQAEADIRSKITEIEARNKLMMDREERILEMKGEVNKLLIELGREKKYKTAISD